MRTTRLSLRDLYAALTLAAVVGVYAGYLNGSTAWLLDSTRGTVGLVLVLGAIGCGFGNAADLFQADRTPATQYYTAATSVIGIAALVAAATGLILASEAALAVLVGTIVALWLLATVRHAMVPTTVTVHERDLHEVIRPTVRH